MRIVVTGASGFLGSWVCRVLGQTHDVIALVRPDSSLYRLKGISQISIYKIEETQWGIFLNDLQADAWISLDWNGVSNIDRNSTQQITNVQRIANLCRQITNIPTVIGTGSQAELGPLKHAISEDESDAPTTLYGEAKAATRISMRSILEERGLRFAWARIFSTYGALDSIDWLIPSTIEALTKNQQMPLTKGEQQWSFLHAYDAAKAYETILTHPEIDGIVNVGNPKTVQIRDVTTLIGRELGKTHLLGFGEVEYRSDQVMKLAPVCKKLNSAQWLPEIELEDGVRHLINWMSYNDDVAIRSNKGIDHQLHIPARVQI